jgi:hypothetical protein
MKSIRQTSLYLTLLACTGGMGLLAQTISAAEPAADEAWKNSAFEAIRQSEYEIRWIEDQGVYKSANRAHNLRFTYHNDGFHVEPRRVPDGEEIPWHLELRLARFGKTAGLGQTVGVPLKWTVQKRTATVDNEGISIEYFNSDEGMRQNFIIESKPEGEAALALEIEAASEELILNVNEPEDFAYFTTAASGEEILQYNSLKVWDASMRILEARMLKVSATAFAIVIDDEQAVYPITVDPTIGIIQLYPGSANTMEYGFSVAMTGKIFNPANGQWANGIIIGAPYWDSGGYADTGKVFVYHGGNHDVPTTANWTKEGPAANARFGWSVASAGDVDNNSFDDVIIGAPYYNSNDGKAFIYGGTSSGLGASPIWQQSGPSGAGSLYGYSVAGSIGGSINVGSVKTDVNADGYADFIVGAPYHNYPGTQNGKAYIYKGVFSGAPSTTEFWSSTGSASYDHFGFSVALVADVNGDTKEDAVVGAPDNSSSKGKVYVYHGATSMSTTPSQSIAGEVTGDQFGFSVASAGTVDNNTTYNGIVVGAPYYDEPSYSSAGRAYVFKGSSTGIQSTAFWTSSAINQSAGLGFSVAGGFDFDADGKNDDFIIGIPWFDGPGGYTDGGRNEFYLGASGSSPVLTDSKNGLETNAKLGWSVAGGPYDRNNTAGTLTGAKGWNSYAGSAIVHEYTP